MVRERSASKGGVRSSIEGREGVIGLVYVAFDSVLWVQ